MKYRYCGNPGLLLSELALGFWHIPSDYSEVRDIVRSGKALYVGISKYPADMAAAAYDYLSAHDVPCIAYQGKYNMMVRGHEQDILPQCAERGVGRHLMGYINEGPEAVSARIRQMTAALRQMQTADSQPDNDEPFG